MNCIVFTYRVFNDFVINVFNNFWITSKIPSQVLLGMRILNKCTKQQIMHRNIFLAVYSLSILLFFENSSNKASGLLFIFVHVCTDHAHFSNDKICISCEPDRPTLLFSVEEHRKSLLWKPDSMSMVSCHTRFLAWKRNPPLTSTVAYCRVYWAFILCIKAVFTTWKVAHVDQFVQTNKDR